MCWILAICGTVATHFVWDKFFAVLILSKESICWKCPFRKSKKLSLANCIEIGAYIENAQKGIPSEQIYFSDYASPIRKVDKNGVIKSSQHLIKFPYSDELCDYLIKKYPNTLTESLSTFRHQQKTTQ